MMGKTIDEIELGQTAEFSKTISESDVYLYAGVTGDFNPAHINHIYAEKTVFRQRVAHGMIPAGLISTVLGNLLPGPGTIYVQQTLSFKKPVVMGDTITAKVEVIEIQAEKKRVRLQTVCTNQNGDTVLDGEALVSPPRKA